ncbi:MAG TPA: hypothetical protein VJT73_09900, partial [Polyangiaceae bacterium]|nr:hypothetical protein [Polyangiaceae bacterium]
MRHHLKSSVLFLAIVSACSSETTDTPSSITSGGASGSSNTTSSAGTTATSGSGGTDVASGTGGTDDTTGGSGGSAGGAPDAGSNDRPDAQTPAQDGGGATKPDPSAGCGKAPGQALATYVKKTLGGTSRTYQIYFPDGYDPMRAYPTIFLGHGCGGGVTVSYPIQNASKTEAIVVLLKSVGSCFVYDQEGEDVKYFDQLLAEVSANACVDKKRVFVTGFSSGSWLAHTLG